MFSTSIPVTVEQRSTAAPETVFAVVVPIDLPLIFHRLGPIPGVVRTEQQSGPWDRPGRTRVPHFTDGSTAFEEMLEYTHPHSFAYRVSRFTNPVLRFLVDHLRGEWTFTPDGDATTIRWTYAFAPRHRLLVRYALAPVWRVYMNAALARAVALTQSAPVQTGTSRVHR